MTTRKQVYKAIDTERDYQDKVWHRKETDKLPELTIGEYVLLLQNYIDQAKQKWNYETPPEDETMHLIRKIAGIAVNAMEKHGAFNRDPTILFVDKNREWQA